MRSIILFENYDSNFFEKKLIRKNSSLLKTIWPIGSNKYPWNMAYYKTRNAGTRNNGTRNTGEIVNTGGTAEHPETVAEQRNTPEH